MIYAVDIVGAAVGTLVEVQMSQNGMDDEAIVALYKSMVLNPNLEVLNLYVGCYSNSNCKSTWYCLLFVSFIIFVIKGGVGDGASCLSTIRCT